MMKKIASVLVVSVWVVACSDDTFIATNEPTAGAAGSSSGGDAGGGAGGLSGGGGVAGNPGGAGGVSGSSGSGGSGGNTACTPGQTEELGSCDKCGTKRRTCENDGSWGPEQCQDQGACNPGDIDTSGCSDPCAAKVCGQNCSFSACKLKPGADCLYESGSNFQCCGTDKWQYCSSTTCTWYPCAACNGCSAC